MKRPRGTFGAAKAHAALSTGEVIRMLRELKGWTQAELARRAAISASKIGKKRAEQLARAFDVHPAIIMFPEYEAREIGRAA
jgi:transcriptional regulator with XRE-family HTH domain